MPVAIRPIIHILLHLLVPGAVAKVAFPRRWQTAWLVMALTLLVDLDHLLAVPIYDPNRCSIGFHPLHSLPAIALYSAALLVPVLRMVAAGLLVHMGLDLADCVWMGWGF